MKIIAGLAAIMLCLPGAMCQTGSGYPDSKDIAAITEAKPRPGPETLTDPIANDRYNSSLEGWGDRLHAAGMRLCRFYKRSGLPKADCGK
ncbi:hypothetical protein [Novosphingobium gossypii]|uniref:hypothetical protein n=1 Tax=Novosphingobium gossypii TaxID=1604774 RepID=UPI003D1C8DB9